MSQCPLIQRPQGPPGQRSQEWLCTGLTRTALPDIRKMKIVFIFRKKKKGKGCNHHWKPSLVQTSARAKSRAEEGAFSVCISLCIYLFCQRHFQTCHFNPKEFVIHFGISITVSLKGEDDMGSAQLLGEA